MMCRAAARPGVDRPVEIPPLGLPGTLVLPEATCALVLFAHGSGSSRLSPRNRLVAEGLHECGFGTLRFDLLREEEARDRENVFDVPLLARRLLDAARWLAAEPDTHGLRIGYFGASTGAAAALRAAADGEPAPFAVVSRGGRPDLAAEALTRVEAPTLLVVGAHDPTVLGLNRAAFHALHCEKELAVVPGATHLFEEPGTLEEVTRLAQRWFEDHAPARPAR